MPVSGKKRDDESFGPQIFRHAQARGNAAAARAAGKNSFLLHQAAREDEAFLVVHLQHVVENLKIHGGRKNIFADAFDDVGLGFADFAGLHKIVVERADRDRRRRF